MQNQLAEMLDICNAVLWQCVVPGAEPVPSEGKQVRSNQTVVRKVFVLIERSTP